MYEITQVNKTVIPCFVLPLICCCLFSLLSFYHILFMTEKYAKGPGTRKDVIKRVKRQACLSVLQRVITSYLNSSRPLFCSRVASDIFQSKRSCHLNFLFDFWVLRDSLSYPLASNRVTSGQTGLALFPKIKQVQTVEFNGAVKRDYLCLSLRNCHPDRA